MHDKASASRPGGVVEPQACIETPCARTGRPRCRLVRTAAGRWGNAMSDTTHMHDSGESYGGVLPTKRPNKRGKPPEEAVEERPPTKENAGQPNPYWTPSQGSGPSGLDRVREAARQDGKTRFTALLHHVTVDLLRESFHSLKRGAAPGVDGVTWQQYEDGLEERLVDLHGRVHTGTYRAQPSKRAYIPKLDGRMRPLGIAALEDKIVQQAVVTVLNAIYEEDFLGFSYGFRPGRGAPGPPPGSGGAGRADGGDCVEEGELDSGCGYPWLFR